MFSKILQLQCNHSQFIFCTYFILKLELENSKFLEDKFMYLDIASVTEYLHLRRVNMVKSISNISNENWST